MADGGSNLSWEEMVTDVCVLGRPDKIDALALDWQALYQNARTVSQSLRDGLKDLQDKWKGPAADEYRAKIESIATAIEQIETDDKGIVTLLQTAGPALRKAQQQMPVPDNMLGEVQNRRAQLDAANLAATRTMIGSAFAVETLGLSYVGANFIPGSWLKGLANSFVGNWGRDALGWLTSKLQDWNGQMTAQARQVYNGVDQTFNGADLVTPQPAVVRANIGERWQQLTLPTGPGAGGTSGLPGTGAHGPPHVAGHAPNTSGLHPPGPGGTGSGGAGPLGPGSGGYHPPGTTPPGTTLAGAGGQGGAPGRR